MGNQPPLFFVTDRGTTIAGAEQGPSRGVKSDVGDKDSDGFNCLAHNSCLRNHEAGRTRIAFEQILVHLWLNVGTTVRSN